MRTINSRRMRIMTSGHFLFLLIITCASMDGFKGVANAGLIDPSTPGLLRLLAFDGNANDATGTENGVIVGDPTFPTTGCVDGACLELNGNDAVTFDTLFNIVPPQWSVEVWVKFDQLPSVDCMVITGKRQGGDFIENYIAYTEVCPPTNTFAFFSWAGGPYGTLNPYINIIAPDPVMLNEWYMLTFTFDGTTYRGFVNGQEVGSQTGPPVPNGTATKFRIGGRDAGPIDLFVIGRVDEFAAYNRALTPAEILTHYLAGAVPANQPPVALCKNVTVNTTINLCSAPASIDNGSYDPDGTIGTPVQSPLGPYIKGMTNVTLTVTDNQGATNSCNATVTVVDNQPPAIMCPAPPPVQATGPSGAIATFSSPTVSDNCSGAIAVSCSPAAGSTFPIGSTPVSCSATDASANQNSCAFAVTVIGAADQINNLIALIQGFNLPQGTANSLIVKLQNAGNSVQSGNVATACNQINAFINEAQAQSGKKLTVAQANQMITSANQIRAVLGCS